MENSPLKDASFLHPRATSFLSCIELCCSSSSCARDTTMATTEARIVNKDLEHSGVASDSDEVVGEANLTDSDHVSSNEEERPIESIEKKNPPQAIVSEEAETPTSAPNKSRKVTPSITVTYVAPKSTSDIKSSIPDISDGSAKLVKRVRFASEEDMPKETPVIPKKTSFPTTPIPDPDRSSLVSSFFTWSDAMKIGITVLLIVVAFKLVSTPTTIIVSPPERDTPRNQQRYRDAEPDPRPGEPARSLFKGHANYPGFHKSHEREPEYANDNELIEEDERRGVFLNEAVVSGSMHYFLNHFDAVKRVQHYELLRNATDFIRGYARMKIVCDELINALGLRSLVQHHSGQGDALKSRFDDHLYLASGSVYSPNFCVNIPDDILFNHSPDAKIRRQSAETEAHRRLNTSWREMTSDGTVVTSSIAPSQVLSSSSVHSPTLMGYFARHFYARDLQALGNKTNTSLVIQSASYTIFADGLDASSQASEKPVCLCGAHINMARHIVIFADRSAPKGRLYIEPTIISKHDTATVSTATMPWTHSPFDRYEATSYQRVEESLRTELKLAAIQSSNQITVDSMQLAYAIEGLARFLKYEGSRQVSSLSGSEAHCISYCEALTYAIQRSADELARAHPQEVLLSSSVLPKQTIP